MTWIAAQRLARAQGHQLLDEGWITLIDVDGTPRLVRRVLGAVCRRTITALRTNDTFLEPAMRQPCRTRTPEPHYASDE